MIEVTECIATAIAASYMNIPLAHTQGGEVTGSIDESVRHAITKLAHIHFPATEKARDNVIRMGEDPEKGFMSGRLNLRKRGAKRFSKALWLLPNQTSETKALSEQRNEK